MRGRRRKGWLALCALGVSAGVLAASAGGGAAACILVCPPTTSSTTTTPPPEEPPVVSDVRVRAISDSAVTVEAAIDPNGQSTGWYLSLQPVGGDVGSPVTLTGGQLAPGSAAIAVSRRARGLAPNVRYTASVMASNLAGEAHAPQVKFKTRLEPKLPITLAVKHPVVVIDTEPGLVATVHGRDPYDSINLYFKPQGSRRYHFAGSSMASTRRVRPIFDPDENGSVRAVLAGHPYGDRNRFRPPSTSNVLRVIVFPRLELSVSQDPSDPALADVDAFYVAHPVPRGFVGGPIYLYRSTQRSGPYERFAVLPLRHERNAYYRGVVGASTQLRASPPLWVRACVRHEPVPDMGTPFTDRSCGALMLP
jgi:hypothetical protein